MEYLELIRKRYSVRAYKPDPVPDELLAQVLEAGGWRLTAANKQPIRIIVIHTRGREAELRRIYHRVSVHPGAADPGGAARCGRRRGSGRCTTARVTPTWTRPSSWIISSWLRPIWAWARVGSRWSLIRPWRGE